jgi:hypothetical protein
VDDRIRPEQTRELVGYHGDLRPVSVRLAVILRSGSAAGDLSGRVDSRDAV